MYTFYNKAYAKLQNARKYSHIHDVMVSSLENERKIGTVPRSTMFLAITIIGKKLKLCVSRFSIYYLLGFNPEDPISVFYLYFTGFQFVFLDSDSSQHFRYMKLCTKLCLCIYEKLCRKQSSRISKHFDIAIANTRVECFMFKTFSDMTRL